MVRGPSADLGAIELDMTPMIDVVFQLIIFFMLCTDMGQQQLAEVKLPQAHSASQDDPEAGRLTVNFLPDGTLEIRRQRYGRLGELTEDGRKVEDAVRIFLAQEVAKGRREEGGFSDRAVLIRADRSTEFKHVQKIMRLCGEQGIQIYRVMLAAAQPMGGEALDG